METAFVCYDKTQRNFFRDNGIKDIVYGLHPKTMKPFWVFIRNKRFEACMQEWVKRKF